MTRVQLALVTLVAIFALVGCGGSNVAAGFVIDVRSSSITQIDSFVLRTPEGVEMQFKVGRTELEGGSFPATHLREHMALNQPVAVAFKEENGERVAYLLKDAPWLQP